MYDNHIIISLKQKKIKLNHNTSVTGVCVSGGGGGGGKRRSIRKQNKLFISEQGKGPLIDLTAAF